MSVDIREDIELAIVISDGWSPDALTVSLLTVFQAEFVAKTKEVLHSIAAESPVDEVLGM